MTDPRSEPLSDQILGTLLGCGLVLVLMVLAWWWNR